MSPAERVHADWLLVANAAHARVMSRFGRSSPGLVRQFESADARQQGRFAQELAAYLEQGAAAGVYARVAIFAPAPFIALLERSLGAQTQQRLVGAFAVDLSHGGKHEMETRIDHLLRHSESP